MLGEGEHFRRVLCHLCFLTSGHFLWLAVTEVLLWCRRTSRRELAGGAAVHLLGSVPASVRVGAHYGLC